MPYDAVDTSVQLPRRACHQLIKHGSITQYLVHIRSTSWVEAHVFLAVECGQVACQVGKRRARRDVNSAALPQARQLHPVDRAQATLTVATFERLHARNHTQLSALQGDHVGVAVTELVYSHAGAPAAGSRS